MSWFDARKHSAALLASSLLDRLGQRDHAASMSYQELTETLEAWLAEDHGKDSAEWLDGYADPHAALHEDAPNAAWLAQQLATMPGEALLLSGHGEVLACNAAAGSNLGCKPGCSIRALGCSLSHFQSQVARLLELKRRTVFLRANAENTLPHMGGMMVLGRTSMAGVFVLWRPLSHEFTPVSEAFSEVFALSAREVAILSALVAGESAESIALNSARSLGTVRQQIKSVLAKLGVRSKAEAVSLVARAGHMAAACPTLLAEPLASDALHYASMIGAHGRVVGYRYWGARLGLPVLVLHGALFGVGDLAAERALASRMGLMCFAIERPGYGRTTLPEQGDLQAVVAEDALALLNERNIKRCVVLAHDIGTLMAMQLAAQFPERIAAIVAAPVTPPMEGWQHTAHMPASLRIHAWAAQRFPRLTDMLVDLGMRQVRQSGFQAFPHLVFKDCPHDLGVWAAQHALETAAGACALIAAQDARGFKRDMHLTNLDWRALVAQVTIPVHLLHGKRSQTVCAQAVERLHHALARSSLEWVDDAGHTLPLSHFALVLKRVRDMGDLHMGV